MQVAHKLVLPSVAGASSDPPGDDTFESAHRLRVLRVKLTNRLCFEAAQASWVAGTLETLVDRRVLDTHRRAAAMSPAAFAAAAGALTEALLTEDPGAHCLTTLLGALRCRVSVDQLLRQSVWAREILAMADERDEIKRRFVLRHLPLLRKLARPLATASLSVADLVQEGALGVLEAVERFDPRRGHRFATYAAWWVRHHMLALRRKRLSVQRESDRRGADDSAPDVDDLAHPGPSSEELVLNKRLEAQLRDAWSCLHPRERLVLQLRFGLGGTQERALRGAGTALALSAERVRQIEQEAIAKLRRRMRVARAEGAA